MFLKRNLMAKAGKEAQKAEGAMTSRENAFMPRKKKTRMAKTWKVK